MGPQAEGNDEVSALGATLHVLCAADDFERAARKLFEFQRVMLECHIAMTFGASET